MKFMNLFLGVIVGSLLSVCQGEIVIDRETFKLANELDELCKGKKGCKFGGKLRLAVKSQRYRCDPCITRRLAEEFKKEFPDKADVADKIANAKGNQPSSKAGGNTEPGPDGKLLGEGRLFECADINAPPIGGKNCSKKKKKGGKKDKGGKNGK